jgi:hypothetical protein
MNFQTEVNHIGQARKWQREYAEFKKFEDVPIKSRRDPWLIRRSLQVLSWA